MLKHKKMPKGAVELTKAEVKKLFIDYLQTLILAHSEDQDVAERLNLANAVAFSDFTADFVVQLLEYIHPVTVMERGFKNDK